MKAKYEDADNSVADMVNKVMNAFPDRFLHINRNDLYLVFKDAEKSSWKAKTRLLNGFYRMLTKKKIVIEIHKQEWVLLKDRESERALVLYRELYRVDKNEKTNDYKLVKPDLQDFTKILEKIGLHNETVDQFFSKVVPVAAK